LVLLLGACTGGGAGSGRAGRAAASTTQAASSVPTTVVTTSSSTVPATADPPGSVTLHAGGLTLPDTSAGGGALRVLVRPASPGLRVLRTGAGGAVTACPVTSVAGPATAAACRDLAPGVAMDVAAWGVELRATGADAAVDEVTVTYVPADDSVTLVTPARPAGACSARPCEATFSRSPSRAGTFSLDGRAGAGRPRLTLSSNSAPGGSISTLATVEGGGNISITATLDGVAPATLAYRDDSSGAVPGFTAEILWP
jgi:hypothetical protein